MIYIYDYSQRIRRLHPPSREDSNIVNDIIDRNLAAAVAAPSPSSVGSAVVAPSPTSSSSAAAAAVVPTPTSIGGIHGEEHFDYIPTAQVQKERNLAPSPCLTNNNTASCPACHFTKTCCMQQNYRIYTGAGNSLGCTSNALDILDVTFLQVFDGGAYECNCNGVGNVPPCAGATTLNCNGKALGTFIGGCTGASVDETVEVEFATNINVKNAEYDISLYINTQGGSGVYGDGGCLLQGLSQTDNAGNVYTSVGNKDGDGCLDAQSVGQISNHPFPRMFLNCNDENNDGLLDFSFGVSFVQNQGECNYMF